MIGVKINQMKHGYLKEEKIRNWIDLKYIEE